MAELTQYRECSARERVILRSLCLVAVVVGLVLRVAIIGGKSPWEDECWTVWRTDKPTLRAVLLDLRDSPFPPLHYVIVWFIRQLSDDNSIATIRLASVIMGTAAIPLTFVIWRRLLSAPAICWTTSLVALNSFHIWYSRDAKMYAGIWLFSMVSCGAYLWCLYGKPRARDYVLLAVSNCCLLLTSYVGVGAIMIQAIHGVSAYCTTRRLRKSCLYCAFWMMFAAFPVTLWLPYAASAVKNKTGISWVPQVTSESVIIDTYHYAALVFTGFSLVNYTPLDDRGILLLESVFLVVVSTCVTIASYVVDNTRRGRESRMEVCDEWNRSQSWSTFEHPEVIRFLLLWALLPPTGAILFSWLGYSVWGVPRYLMAAAPAPVILTGICLAGSRRRLWGAIVGSGLIAINMAAQAFVWTAVTRVPWNEVAAVIDQASETYTELTSSPENRPIIACLGIDPVRFDINSLKFQLESKSNQYDGSVVDLFESTTARDASALLVLLQSDDRTDTTSQSEIIRFLPQYECVILYQIHSYEEVYSRLPAPLRRLTTEVWFCRKK